MTEQGGYFAADAELEDEGARLRLLAQLYDPATIRLLTSLGVSQGWHCADIGAGGGSITGWLSDQVGASGRVLATDVDTRHLTDLPTNVEVSSHDITAEDLESDAFDLVHCRFVLAHLGDPGAALRRMVAALRPGGWLLVEEPDATPLAAIDKDHPRASSFDTMVSSTYRFLKTAGVYDIWLGRSLPDLFDGLGLSDIDNEAWCRIVRGGEPFARWHEHGFDRVDQMLLDNAIVTDAGIADRRRAHEDPTFLMMTGLVVACWGRRAADRR
jgi:SAM-dependent methyltransferase